MNVLLFYLNHYEVPILQIRNGERITAKNYTFFKSYSSYGITQGFILKLKYITRISVVSISKVQSYYVPVPLSEKII